MKQRMLQLMLPLLIHGISLAQPVLNAGSLNTIGDQIHYQPCQLSVVTEGPAGANQTWNFSGVIPKNGHDYIIYYVDPAETPNSNLFPFANLATRYTDAGGAVSYAYFNQTGSEYWYLGATFEENSEILSNPNLLARLPMTYGQATNSSYEGEQDLVSFQAAIYGEKSMKYDGYGTLILPDITYTNAIRTKTTEIRTDSVTSFSGGAYTLNRTNSTLYAWFVPGIKSAVFEIRYSTLTTITYFPGVPIQQTVLPEEKTITMQLNPGTSNAHTLGPEKVGVRLLSANPSAQGDWFVEIQPGESPVKLFLCDALGRCTSVQNGRNDSFHVDGSLLPAGTYWLLVQEESGAIVSDPLAIVKL